MEYVLLFLEGILTFLSPCILPMLPIYLSYLLGGNNEKKEQKTNANVFGFVLGFTIIFILIGALTGSIGAVIKNHQEIINFITGAIVLFFGFNYLGILNIKFLAKTLKIDYKMKSYHFIPAILFGMTFAIGWSPCVGTFLGTALMSVIISGNIIKGMFLLLIYSFGLGIPLVLCGIFVESLKDTIAFFRRNLNKINMISGVFLIVIGIAMMSGMYYKLLSILML